MSDFKGKTYLFAKLGVHAEKSYIPVVAHWPSFALFYWMTWPWCDDVIRPRYVRTLFRVVKFASERALIVAEIFFGVQCTTQGKTVNW